MHNPAAIGFVSLVSGATVVLVTLGLALWLFVSSSGRARGLALGALACSLLTLVSGAVYAMTGWHGVSGIVTFRLVNLLLHLLTLGLFTAAVVARREPAAGRPDAFPPAYAHAAAYPAYPAYPQAPGYAQPGPGGPEDDRPGYPAPGYAQPEHPQPGSAQPRTEQRGSSAASRDDVARP